MTSSSSLISVPWGPLRTLSAHPSIPQRSPCYVNGCALMSVVLMMQHLIEVRRTWLDTMTVNWLWLDKHITTTDQARNPMLSGNHQSDS